MFLSAVFGTARLSRYYELLALSKRQSDSSLALGFCRLERANASVLGTRKLNKWDSATRIALLLMDMVDDLRDLQFRTMLGHVSHYLAELLLWKQDHYFYLHIQLFS